MTIFYYMYTNFCLTIDVLTGQFPGLLIAKIFDAPSRTIGSSRICLRKRNPRLFVNICAISPLQFRSLAKGKIERFVRILFFKLNFSSGATSWPSLQRYQHLCTWPACAGCAFLPVRIWPFLPSKFTINEMMLTYCNISGLIPGIVQSWCSPVFLALNVIANFATVLGSVPASSDTF